MTDVDRTLRLVNADTSDPLAGHAVMGRIIAAAAAPGRTHTRNAIVSIQFQGGRGVGVLMKDAGTRQHLANALGLPGRVLESRTAIDGVPVVGYFREGEMDGINVQIWNGEY
jgi:hypothetical protein